MLSLFAAATTCLPTDQLLGPRHCKGREELVDTQRGKNSDKAPLVSHRLLPAGLVGLAEIRPGINPR